MRAAHLQPISSLLSLWRGLVGLTAWLISSSAALLAANTATTADGIEFFERKIRPVLVTHCYECHSAESKRLKGGLRLDTASARRRGGDSGPAITAGNPDDSLLISALEQDAFEMPPDGRLSDPIIADFRQWIAMGAPSPVSQHTDSADHSPTNQGHNHWAFQPITPVHPPATQRKNWARNGIDPFILQQLETAGLSPNPRAEDHILIRRATFHTTGMPPLDFAPTATSRYQDTVEALLANPSFGETWGRKWLDLARYADTNGVDENFNYLHAWRYRDYVVRSLNSDKPYNLFLTEQLAGDLLPTGKTREAQADQICATGFLTLGPKMLAEQDKDKLLIDIVDEQIDVVTKTTLGLTVGCARCHDHKFDPITAEDYYALAGIFVSTQTMSNTNHVSFWTETVLPHPDNEIKRTAHQQALADLSNQITLLKEQPETDETRDKIKSLQREHKSLKEKGPNLPKAMAVIDATPQDIPVHIRGSHLNLGKRPVSRGFPKALTSHMASRPISEQRSGRLALARWLTQSDNPLTARVMVNRVWQGYFGRGLVDTPSNFGLRGTPPSHPALLDWLAQELIRHDWSLKHIHRLILTSATYQQSSKPHPFGERVDPENTLLWRQNRQRLSAEAIRDSVLTVSEGLDGRIGGIVAQANRNETYYRGDGTEFQSPRRALYLPVIRGRGYEMFNTFDYSESGAHLAQRTATVVPHQALFMMNAPLVTDAAERLASRLSEDATQSRPEQLVALYHRLFHRAPSIEERQRGEAFLAVLETKPDPSSHRTPLGLLIQSLIATNEFIYVD